MFPEEYEKVKIQSSTSSKVKPLTPLRLITTRISSLVTVGRLSKIIKIDDTEIPKKVKFVSKEEFDKNIIKEIEEDLEPLNRQEIIKNSLNKLKILDLYKIAEFENIQKAFKQYFGLDFEIDHAHSLLNNDEKGEHHPNNFQFLLKLHNNKKNNDNWKRFTFIEQIDYIKKAIILHNTIADKLDIEIDDEILNLLFKRLENVY